MTQADRDSVVLIFRAAAKDPKRARHIMGREDISAEQAETIMVGLADIFEVVATTNPALTMKEAIDRAVWCAHNEIQTDGIAKAAQKTAQNHPHP